MRVANLKLDEFMVAVKDINAALSDQNRYEEFLNEASSDTPIIAGLLEQLAILEVFPDSTKKRVGRAAAHRDLVVLLALRHLEKAEDATVN